MLISLKSKLAMHKVSAVPAVLSVRLSGPNHSKVPEIKSKYTYSLLRNSNTHKNTFQGEDWANTQHILSEMSGGKERCYSQTSDASPEP